MPRLLPSTAEQGAGFRRGLTSQALPNCRNRLLEGLHRGAGRSHHPGRSRGSSMAGSRAGPGPAVGPRRISPVQFHHKRCRFESIGRAGLVVNEEAQTAHSDPSQENGISRIVARTRKDAALRRREAQRAARHDPSDVPPHRSGDFSGEPNRLRRVPILLDPHLHGFRPSGKNQGSRGRNALIAGRSGGTGRIGEDLDPLAPAVEYRRATCGRKPGAENHHASYEAGLPAPDRRPRVKKRNP